MLFLLKFLVAAYIIFFYHTTLSFPTDVDHNQRPIIGILAQEVLDSETHKPIASYISAGYVKLVESGGAQVVPIFICRDESYLRTVFSKINGLILPGGDAPIPGAGLADSLPQAFEHPVPGGYAATAQFLMKLARKANEAGTYFPVWGECLGLELMMGLAAGTGKVLSKCDAWNILLPLQFTTETPISRLFGKADPKLLSILSLKKITPNFHHYCVTVEDFVRYQIYREWALLGVGQDRNGVLFSAVIEHRKYPFYSLQFHPEKNVFEWYPTDAFSHTKESTEVTQYFSGFIVNEARKNRHAFQSIEEETVDLIYHYQPNYAGIGSNYVNSGFTEEHFVQIYIFEIANVEESEFLSRKKVPFNFSSW